MPATRPGAAGGEVTAAFLFLAAGWDRPISGGPVLCTNGACPLFRSQGVPLFSETKLAVLAGNRSTYCWTLALSMMKEWRTGTHDEVAGAGEFRRFHADHAVVVARQQRIVALRFPFGRRR